MIFKVTDLSSEIIFIFNKNLQWLSLNQKDLKKLQFINIKDTKIFVERFKNDTFYISSLAKIFEMYINDFSKEDIMFEGEGANLVYKEIENFWNKKEKIQQSYNDVINKNYLVKGLNTRFYNSNFRAMSFQEEHAQNIISKKDSANFSSPGAGKTIIAFMAIASLLAEQQIQDIVVFGPKSASIAWTKEWETVIDNKYVNKTSCKILNFSNKSKKFLNGIKNENLDDEKLNIWFINFHKLNDKHFMELLINKLSARNFMLIIDEAHYTKNMDGIWHNNIIPLSIEAKYSLVLTGTPIPRKAGEGNYILNLIWPWIKHENLETKNFQDFEKNPDNHQLKKEFKKIYSRINKDTLVKRKELKKLHQIDIFIEMTDVESYLLNNLLNNEQMSNYLEFKSLAKMNKALLIRLMQASSYPPLLNQTLEESLKELKEDLMDVIENKNESQVYFEEENMFREAQNTKAKKVEEKLQNLLSTSMLHKMINSYTSQEKISTRWLEAIKKIDDNPNENIVVWDIFRKSMADFQKFLRENLKIKRKVYLINGQITGEKRLEYLDKFKKDTNAILIASPATIAESISLHRACHKAIYLYKNYVGSHWMQSKDRIHRLVGPNEQSYEKIIYNIVAKRPSIDQHIMENLKEKTFQQKQLID